MSIATMTDRSLPLAERVAEMVGLFRLWPKGYSEASDELLADIAPADPPPRAVVRREAPNQHGQTFVDSVNEWSFALATYRNRVAQGVAHG